MTSSNWISRKVGKLMPGKNVGQDAPQTAPDAIEPASSAALADPGQADTLTAAPGPAAAPTVTSSRRSPRSTTERLKATFRQDDEALSPREMRHKLAELQAVVDSQVSEVEGGRRARLLALWYTAATPGQRRDLWLLMSEQFVADPQVIKQAQAEFDAALGTPDQAVAEVNFRRATVSRRRRLLQRFSAFAEGIRFLVDLRAEMLPLLKSDKRLQALDVEMEYMFSTWFDVGFLDLRRISWHSPASLIEKLIKYESVHDIKSWADMKNRLDSDRRCYGFFHPSLPNEPLIFVEVALVDAIASSITPLLDESADAVNLNKATTAIFYSISNTQVGLRGVSFGDSLIKHVVDVLKAEFPHLKTFATLSPIPGFRTWLGKNVATMMTRLDDKTRAELKQALQSDTELTAQLLADSQKSQSLDAKSPVGRFLLQCAAHYLSRELVDGKPTDPVARFHLGNGARIERLNWGADPSIKGMKQSCGMMVNYLYDLKRLDKHRAQLAQGRIPVSREIDSLKL